jgi:hypothetical protein
VILPFHPQSFPSPVLPGRLEEYVSDDAPPTTSVSAAKYISPSRVYDLVVWAQKQLGLANVTAQYFVGTVTREADFKTNEWDTEVAKPKLPHGYQSVGIYQIGSEEAGRYGFRLEEMLDPVKSTVVMVRLAEAHRVAIRKAAGLSSSDPDPADINAYLAIAHNKGTSEATLSIAQYGLDWSAYKSRPENAGSSVIPYGDDCISGGPRYAGIVPGSSGTLPSVLPKPDIFYYRSAAPVFLGVSAALALGALAGLGVGLYGNACGGTSPCGLWRRGSI